MGGRHVAPERGPGPKGEGGFALFVVVLLLFAIGASAAATYQVVLLENELSGFSSDSERARTIAEAGLNRFLGEAVRGVPDSTEYFLDGGEAQVSGRRIQYLGPWEERYRIHSVGRFLDPRHFEAPAIWEVAEYARLRAPPMNVLATVAATGDVNVLPPPVGNAEVDGTDQANPGQCRVAQTNVADYVENQSLEDLGIPPWPRLLDLAYPVDVHWTGGAWSLPGGYPVVRVTQDPFTAGNNRSGQGVLIVPGDMAITQQFQWNGIILVGGSLTTVGAGQPPTVQGMILAGLAGGLSPVSLTRGEYEFHSCHVLGAGLSMAVLNPESQGWWSAF